jgi:hypothetical protein
MKRIFQSIGLILVLAGCTNEGYFPSVPCTQGVEATVRNLTGLDGCGFVFELEDGTKLEPQRLFFCGTPPLPKEAMEDPLYQFEFVDGKKVVIGYETLSDMGSYCMVGPVVKITCLEEVGAEQTPSED